MNKEAKQASYPHNMIIDTFGRDSEHIEEALSAFTDIIKKRCPASWERNLCILNYYYREGLTLEATGAELNLSRERVRQIICKYKRLLKSVDAVLFPEDVDTNLLKYWHFSARTENALRRRGIDSISDIMNTPPDKMLNIPSIGKNGIGEIMHIVGDEYFKKYWPKLASKINFTALSATDVYHLFKSYVKCEED